MAHSPAAQRDATSTTKPTALRADAAVFVPSAAVVFVQPWIASGWHNGSACEQSRPEVDRRRASSRRSKFRGRPVCPTSYLSEDGELFASERQGFMAAGALLWRRDSSGTAVALMALELRSGAPRYNFIGGKRDSEDETPRVVAAREAHEETGGLLSASARRSMEQGLARQPVLWHANGKFVLFVHELLEPDAQLAERVEALGGRPDPGDPHLLSLHWVPLRQLLSRSWCREHLHGYTANQLVLLRPHLASLVGGIQKGRDALVGGPSGERSEAPPPSSPPPPTPAPVHIERRRGGEVLRVLVEARVALAEVREAAAAGTAAEAAVAAVRSAPPADSVGEHLSSLRLQDDPSPEPEPASACPRHSVETKSN